MAAGEVDAVLHRRRPDRRQRRHREQDRHLRARRAAPRHHGIPFYVVAPSSTVDHATASGAEIPIEERDPAEVTARFAARNPAFDVTPAALITAIVTEHGVHAAPYARVARARGGRRVKALLLAAGYATRLRPLTDTVAKPLLPVGGRPMIDWIVDRVAAADEIDEVHVVTNSALRARLRALGRRRASVVVHDDGTTLERRPPRRDRRHPLRDRARRARRRRPARDRRRQPVRVLARATTSPSGAARATAARSPSTGSPTRRSRRSTASSSSTTTTGSSASRRSPSDRAATSSRRRRTSSRAAHVALLERYLDEGNPPDPPGRFLDLAQRARAGLRLPLRRGVARHRRPGAAARGRQPVPRAGRASRRGPSTRRRSATRRAAGAAQSWHRV